LIRLDELGQEVGQGRQACRLEGCGHDWGRHRDRRPGEPLVRVDDSGACAVAATVAVEQLDGKNGLLGSCALHIEKATCQMALRNLFGEHVCFYISQLSCSPSNQSSAHERSHVHQGAAICFQSWG
jgi:hypothetical protein